MTSKTLDRSTFRDLLHGTFGMTDDFFMDRGVFQLPPMCSIATMMQWGPYKLVMSCMLPPVFRAFDKDNDSYLSPKEWVQGMSVMLRGTLDEKMECELVTSLITGWLLFCTVHSLF